MPLKRIDMLIASLIVLAINASSVWAAGEASSTINIKAVVPTKQFHVLALNPTFGKNETMAYNPTTETLTQLTQRYSVKNTDGAVHAYIEGGPIPLFNGNSSQNIALTTTFNGKVLTALPQEVVDDATSTPGTQTEMVITAAKPSDAASGLFTASYTVMFDNVPRVP